MPARLTMMDAFWAFTPDTDFRVFNEYLGRFGLPDDVRGFAYNPLEFMAYLTMRIPVLVSEEHPDGVAEVWEADPNHFFRVCETFFLPHYQARLMLGSRCVPCIDYTLDHRTLVSGDLPVGMTRHDLGFDHRGSLLLRDRPVFLVTDFNDPNAGKKEIQFPGRYIVGVDSRKYNGAQYDGAPYPPGTDMTAQIGSQMLERYYNPPSQRRLIIGVSVADSGVVPRLEERVA